MKKTILCLLLFLISITTFSQIKANVKMLNGDEIPCDIMTETLDLVTDYGELSFETKYIKTIQFPEPGKGNTILNTIFGEAFRGFITNDIIRLNVYGSEMEIRKAKINNITFLNEPQQAKDYKITVSLRNGDAFYATPADSIINIQTSYGEVKLPFENMSEISFEGFGNVLTKIKMKDGGVLQGIIKDDYIPIKLLSKIELEVVPDLMKEIKFSLKDKFQSIKSDHDKTKISIVESFSPVNKTVFNHYPRKTKLMWNEIKDVSGYLVVVQYCWEENENNPFGIWKEGNYGIDEVSFVEENEFDFSFVGAQPGRWRVKAVKNKSESDEFIKKYSEWFEKSILEEHFDNTWSDWVYFRYTR